MARIGYYEFFRGRNLTGPTYTLHMNIYMYTSERLQLLGHQSAVAGQGYFLFFSCFPLSSSSRLFSPWRRVRR